MSPIRVMLQRVRLLHNAFLVTPFLFIYLLTMVRPVAQSVQPAIVVCLAVAAFAASGVALFFRTRQVKASEEKLRTRPNDPAALNEWRSGNILSFVLAESCGLFGLVLKLLGAEWQIVGPFFAFAILRKLWWTPRLAVPEVS